jgi:hypothetical protein
MWRNPITRTACCCASAASGHANTGCCARRGNGQATEKGDKLAPSHRLAPFGGDYYIAPWLSGSWISPRDDASQRFWSQVPDTAAQPMPGVGRIEFENESVTVLRVHMAPHEKTPMHDIVSARLVIWLTNAHLKDTGSDGSVSEYNRPAGSIDWVMPRRHMGENLSDQGLDFLAIIPKVVSASGPHGTLPQ